VAAAGITVSQDTHVNDDDAYRHGQGERGCKEVSEPVNHEDDSRFFVTHEGVSDEERMDHPPSPAPDPEDHSEPVDHDAMPTLDTQEGDL